MNTSSLSFLLLYLLSPALASAVELKPLSLPSNLPSNNPLLTNTPSNAPTATKEAATATSAVVAATPTVVPVQSIPTNASAQSTISPSSLVTRELPEIHATMLLPKDWTLLPGKLLEGDVLLATREKIASESDAWTTGLSMTIDRNGAKDSGQKASVYALGLAREANEKAGEEATPIKESQSGTFHEIRFDFSVAGDQPLTVTEVLRANNETGTLAVILWQSPKEEATKLHDLREQILTGIKLDPTQ